MTQLEAAEGVKGLRVEDITPETTAVMGKLALSRQQNTKPLVQPIYHTSTYKVQDVDDYLECVKEVCRPGGIGKQIDPIVAQGAVQ